MAFIAQIRGKRREGREGARVRAADGSGGGGGGRGAGPLLY